MIIFSIYSLSPRKALFIQTQAKTVENYLIFVR